MIKRVLLASYILISGCAVKPISTNHSFSNLQIQLSKNDKSDYLLIDSENNVVSKANGNNGVLDFSIPIDANTSQCFYILNKKKEEPIFKDTPYFWLPLSDQYKILYYKKKNLEVEENEIIRKINNYQRSYEDELVRLKKNRAFSNDRCVLPSMKTFPDEPYTICKDEVECYEEGAAICYSRFFGTEGCGIALHEYNMPGLLSSPLCSAIAADLAGEKYNMDDAIVDFLHGLADDYSDSLLKSESIWENLWGLVVKGTNYYVKFEKSELCTNSFVEYHYGPRRIWLEEVQRIMEEPQQTKSKCVSTVKQVNFYYDNIQKLRDKKSALTENIEALNLENQELLQQRSPILFCD